MEKHITLGETVKEDNNIFVLADLSTVWANVAVSAKDLEKVRVGVPAVVTTTSSDSKASGTASYVGSLIREQTRSANAQMVLQNPKLAWPCGLYVNVESAADQADVVIAAEKNAFQTINDEPVIFMRVTGGFIAEPVTTGRSNGEQVKIVKSLKPGTSYTAQESFVIKSELGDGSATRT